MRSETNASDYKFNCWFIGTQTEELSEASSQGGRELGGSSVTIVSCPHDAHDALNSQLGENAIEGGACPTRQRENDPLVLLSPGR